MLYQILTFLTGVGATLVGGACLLRVAMRWQRLSFVGPLGQFVLAISGWLVDPLQRLLPTRGPLDVASLLAAWLVKLLEFGVLMAVVGALHWKVLPVLALLGTIKLAVLVATVVIIVSAIGSWTGNRSLLLDAIDRLAAPMLAPVRRVMPRTGGLDLSPLVVVVLLQVLSIVVSSLQLSVAGGGMLVGAA